MAASALVAIYVVLLAVEPDQVARVLSTQQVAALLGILTLTALLASVATVEVARLYVVPKLPWTSQGHLAAVILAWVPFCVVVTGYWWIKCGSLQ